MLTKYAEAFEVLDAVAIPKNAGRQRLARARRFAHRHHFDFTPRRGYIYVRSRAISSRCNDNFDEFPAAEIKQAYRTFVGKPVFVNHHNADHRRARGVIIDAALHEDTNPDGTEDTWAEVLMEVDAVRFPVLAREVMKGNIARTSMGTDVAYSECTACGNKASSPVDYCQHIPKMKGMKVRRVLASGQHEEVLVAERCYGLGFFENSLLVEDPADPTAYTLGDPEGDPETLAMFASIEREADKVVAEAEGITRIAGMMNVRREDLERQEPRAIDVVANQILADMHERDARQMAEMASEAFYRDTRGVPYHDNYGGTKPKQQKAPPGTKTYHLPESDKKKPGYGQGSAEYVRKAEEEGDARMERERRKIQRERARQKRVPVAASAVDRLLADDLNQRFTALHVHSYGETKAPAKVDTMRAENCPVCGDDEGFNGDKCNVCGYMQPPSQFQDPDLTKAREQDLREDAQDAAGIDPAAQGDLGAEQGAEDLQCTNCGEVFSAEGEPEADTDPALPDEAEAEDADPEHPGHPPNGYGEKARDPDDLGDLADTDDDETFDEEADADHEPVPQGQEEDPEEPEDPTTFDPAVGEGRVTGEPDDQNALPGEDSGVVEEGGQCPVCGEGTLVLVAPQAEEAGEPKMNQVGTDPTKQKPVASRHGSMSKETVDMTAQPNEAQKRRSRMVAAIREQQAQIQTLTTRNDALTQAVATLAVAAGVDQHPKFAGLVREAGLQRRADDTNNSPEGPPATTTEDAKKPDATDDVEQIGSAGDGANKNVTPDGVTDVNNSNVTANPPVLDNLQSVTEPVGGTDAVTPAAGDAGGASQVTVKAPSQEVFDGPGSGGWKSSSAKEESERFTASVRLARMRVATGVEQGEDFSIGQQIFESKASTPEIIAQIAALEPIVAQRQSQPQRQATRHLVPQRAPGVQPSRQPSMQTQAATGREGEDEFMIGGDDLSI